MDAARTEGVGGAKYYWSQQQGTPDDYTAEIQSEGGAVYIHEADLADTANIPLLFISDVPGYMVGSRAEKSGIIRHGAKMIHAVAEATVPKFTLVARKSYGAGYYGMCGRAFDPDLLIAYPGAEISVMGAEGMVSIVARKQLETAENPAGSSTEREE